MFNEGKAARILHRPVQRRGPTIEKLHGYIESQGLKLTGKHHEIYLSDIRKAAPARWKTEHHSGNRSNENNQESSWPFSRTRH